MTEKVLKAIKSDGLIKSGAVHQDTEKQITTTTKQQQQQKKNNNLRKIRLEVFYSQKVEKSRPREGQFKGKRRKEVEKKL